MKNSLRLKLRHPGGKETYSAIAFSTEEKAHKFAKKNKKAFQGCKISIVPTRKNGYTEITTI